MNEWVFEEKGDGEERDKDDKGDEAGRLTEAEILGATDNGCCCCS